MVCAVHLGAPDVPTDDVPIDEVQAIEGRYANYFEIRFTETEFLIDFGQHYAETPPPIRKWRVIVTVEAGRTLSRMLADAVAKYEATPANPNS